MQLQISQSYKTRLKNIVKAINFDHVDGDKLIVFISQGAKTRARARIWGLPHIWQLALQVPVHYCVELIGENFLHLSQSEQDEILIHELLHIPKTFSGALVPHRHGNRKTFKDYHKEVDVLAKLWQAYARNTR
jgi:predicted metallopeptidase